MKKTSLFIMLALLTALYASASFAADTQAAGMPATGADMSAPSATQGAAGSAAENTKDAYHKKVKSDLDAYDQRISELKDKSKKLQGSSKDRFDQALSNLEQRRSEANAKLNILDNASEENWTTSKKDVDDAMVNVKKAYEEARFGL